MTVFTDTMTASSSPAHPTQLSQTETEQIMLVALASTGAGLVVIDDERRVTRMSEVAAFLTGWTETEALGRRFEDLFGCDDRPDNAGFIATLQGLLIDGAGPALRQRAVLTSRHGVSTDVEFSTARIMKANGQVGSHVIVLRNLKRLIDVEDRKSVV